MSSFSGIFYNFVNKNVLLCPLKCLILKKKLQNVYVFHYNLVLNVCYFVKFLKKTLENRNKKYFMTKIIQRPQKMPV